MYIGVCRGSIYELERSKAKVQCMLLHSNRIVGCGSSQVALACESYPGKLCHPDIMRRNGGRAYFQNMPVWRYIVVELA